MSVFFSFSETVIKNYLNNKKSDRNNGREEVKTKHIFLFIFMSS